MSLSTIQILLFYLAGGTYAGDSSVHVKANFSCTQLNVLLYDSIDWKNHKPDYKVFYDAIRGYNSIQDSLHVFNKPLLTIIDFSKPSTDKRLWVIDLESRKVLFNTFVAHGRNSGNVIPTKFSNRCESFESSLGFYKTGSTYSGKHGLSLKLHGLEDGINDQAERRSIVMHGADYVSERFIANSGRLGRSQGCPAVSMQIHKELINFIKDQTCLFIYHTDTTYFKQSKIFIHKDSEQIVTSHPSAPQTDLNFSNNLLYW